MDRGLRAASKFRARDQSSDGYLWVATQDSLARFDGVRFTVFNKANTPAISANRIRALYEDRGNNLWVGLDDGHLVRFYQGVFTPFGSEQRGVGRLLLAKPRLSFSKHELIFNRVYEHEKEGHSRCGTSNCS